MAPGEAPDKIIKICSIRIILALVASAKNQTVDVPCPWDQGLEDRVKENKGEDMDQKAAKLIVDPTEMEALIEARALRPGMEVLLTPEALVEAERMVQAEPAHAGLPLRVYLEGKGCDGFYYGVSFAPELKDDFIFPQGSIRVVVDPKSLRFLYGAKVTWVDDERGRGFLVENPHQMRFRGKFFKKSAWLDALAPGARESSSR